MLQLTQPPEPHRAHAEDGQFRLRILSISTDDLYLGRISADLDSLSHLKCCLSGAESTDENANTNLFISALSQIPMNDGCRVSIFRYPGLKRAHGACCQGFWSRRIRRTVPKKRSIFCHKKGHHLLKRERFQGCFHIPGRPDKLSPFSIGCINRVERSNQRSPSTLVILGSGVSVSTLFRLIRSHLSCDVCPKQKSSTTLSICNSGS